MAGQPQPIEDHHDRGGVVDWKTFTLSTLQSVRELVDVHFQERDKAIKIAIKEVRRRLDVLNHAHEQATADKLQFLTHNAFAPWKDSIEKRLSTIDIMMAKTEGERARLDAALDRMDRMDQAIKENRDHSISSAGRGAGLHAGWGYLVGAIGIVAAIATLLSRFVR